MLCPNGTVCETPALPPSPAPPGYYTYDKYVWRSSSGHHGLTAALPTVTATQFCHANWENIAT